MNNIFISRSRKLNKIIIFFLITIMLLLTKITNVNIAYSNIPAYSETMRIDSVTFVSENGLIYSDLLKYITSKEY